MVITERLCVDYLMQVRAHELCHQVAEGGRERKRIWVWPYDIGIISSDLHIIEVIETLRRCEHIQQLDHLHIRSHIICQLALARPYLAHTDQ